MLRLDFSGTIVQAWQNMEAHNVQTSKPGPGWPEVRDSLEQTKV